MSGAVAGAALGGVTGGLAGYAQGKAKRNAENAYAEEINSVRNQIRDAYSQAQSGWKDYIPELQGGINQNLGFASSLGSGAYDKYLQGAAGQSLGLGYQKATESIAPQLQGETYNLLKNFREESIPALRSQAIDAGAYGGSRDYLNRERAEQAAEAQIVAKAAEDIANQRAQTPSLLSADANSVNNYLNTGTAQGNLMTSLAEQQHEADMAKTNYLWDLAMQYGSAMGSGQAAMKSSTVPWVYGLQGATQGAGAGMGLYNASQLTPQQFFNIGGGKP